MSGLVGAAAPGTMFVRALYNYEADDRTSLSFHEGDIIQVITQLESGWWDGVMNGVRGWFPSNYCQVIESPDEIPDTNPEPVDDEEDDNPVYEDQFDQIEEEPSEDPGMSFEGVPAGDKSRADFWIPQATADGRLFYYNMMTGDRSTELPLESPVSVNETGPMDRMNITMPERTRLPPEMMARGLTRDEDEDSMASASEAEGEMNSHGPMAHDSRTFGSELSTSASMESINGIIPQPHLQTQSQPQPQSQTPTQTQLQSQPQTHPHLQSQAQLQTHGQLLHSRTDTISGLSSGGQAQPPMIASATSFTTTAYNLPTANISRTFFDDGTTPPLTWTRLVQNMKKAISRYREAITSNDRAQYVARAEDISDHLRLLLAAGSGTTDNHSGQPSIISQNKALYPHFRDMMSKFSKLVISSHIAAADWPNAESVQKCLAEADGVFQGVFNYVEVARQQRGEEIPRLFPGFVIGSITGGSWQNNGIGPRDRIAANFYDDDEGPTEPSTNLDDKILERIDEMKRLLVSSLRELDKTLALNDKIVSPLRHEQIGNNVCVAGGRVLDAFKAWISLVENIDLSSINHSVQRPALADFFTSKQSIYDNIADVVIACQAVSGPLADEWSEVRGEALESRLEYVRQCATVLETNSAHLTFNLQGLVSYVQQYQNAQQAHHSHGPRKEYISAREPLRRGDSNPYESGRIHQRQESRSTIPTRPSMLPTQSFTEGEPVGNFRKGDMSKIKKIFGEDPSPQNTDSQAPPHLSLDLDHEISWETKTTPPTVKGGTLEALVEQLTRHDKLDSSFNNTFLLTYRSFTTARELFEMLVKRFSIQPPEGLRSTDYEEWRVKKQMIVRVRVVNILKNWFDNFWMEDYNDDSKQLMRDVYNFARDTVKTAEAPGSAPLMAVLDQRLTGKEAGARRMVQNSDRSMPAPIMPKNMKKLKFLDIDVTEFARQLTIIESRLYSKIKATECLNKTWQKKVGEGEPEPAPNVKALILHSNQMTNWVAEMILAQMDLRKRVVVIKHFVSVADKCRSMNNFSTLTSIISALGTAPISRLKRTWDQVPQRSSNMLETMRTLMASTRNFGEYREALHAANPPCIPFFGVYLTDLTFIEDGIPSIIKKQNLINFAKRAKTAEVIRDIQQYQNVGYNLHTVPELQDYILSNMQAAGDVHEMYDKSLQVEPREREDEKIVSLFYAASLTSTAQNLVTKPVKRGVLKLKKPQPKPKTASWQEDEKKAKAFEAAMAALPRPETNQVDSMIRDSFGLAHLVEEGPDLQLCKHCRKGIYRTNASHHINTCLKLKKEKAQRKKEAREARERAKEAAKEGGKKDDGDKDNDSSDGDDDIPAGKKDNAGKTTRKGAKKTDLDSSKTGKKRKADGEAEKGPKSKKKKEEPKPKVAKPKGPVDVERQCGVLLPNGMPCARSLTCKSHSMGAKRAVAGRSLPYDMLLAAYQKKNQAKQQKAAMDANAPIEEDETGPVDPEEEFNAVMNGLGQWNPRPVVEQPIFEPIKREYSRSRLYEQLMIATNGMKKNIFKVVGFGSQKLPGDHHSLLQPDGEDAVGEPDSGVPYTPQVLPPLMTTTGTTARKLSTTAR
ncbi:uncharacterized protein BROUX77_003146 [Berkeleyomyces rouxiae]|uniref:uncharacterized protein n=1 Tax=Berkeleyomyces rouxiae TaxID=2035830 RepID=UPI003B76E07C